MAPRPHFDRPIAHRGLHDRSSGIIENSRSAFEAAIARDFAIECDVQLSSDGIPVIFHDDDLERLTGVKGPVGSRTLAQLQAVPLLGSATGESPQTLTDFLDQIAGRALLQIELKMQPNSAMSDALARTTTEALAAYNGHVAVESFDPWLLTRMRDNGYAGPLGIITYAYDKPGEGGVNDLERFGLRHLVHWPKTRFSFISCATVSLGLPAVRFFRAIGLPVTAWTVRTPEDQRLAKAGADQIVFEGFDPQSA